MKVAYGLAPHEGGTTTFYRNLAAELRKKGWVVYSVAVGARSAKSFDERFADDFSVLLAPEATDLREKVLAFLEWIEREKVDIVMPMCEETIHAAMPHLPLSVRCITRCATITRNAYAQATANVERLHYVVAICRRQCEALTQHLGIRASKVRLIPHGIEVRRFSAVRDPLASVIRLVYLGRLEDYDKGVMLIPKIVAALERRRVLFTCEILGSGPDMERLRKALRRFSGVTLQGSVTPAQIPDRLLCADVFLMPSRFEGLGFSLLEAMAAGCVPVASHIRGVTDMVIEDGVSGFLCPIGKSSAFADAIARLDKDRELLAEMSQSARKRIEERFTLERMVDDYDHLFRQVLNEPPVDYEVKPLSEIAVPKILRPTWRTKIPLPIKNFARTMLARYFDYYG